MAGIILSTISQKGGVGKSTLARLVAREYANAGWTVKIADLDVSQGTSFNWRGRRLQSSIEPVIVVERFGAVDDAGRGAAQFDLMIIDAPPNSTANTLRTARAADIVIVPTGLPLDDMQPSVLLAHELVQKSVAKAKIAFALCGLATAASNSSSRRPTSLMPDTRCWRGPSRKNIAYRRASDDGRALTETRFRTLNNRAGKQAQSIIDLVTKVQKGRAAQWPRFPRPVEKESRRHPLKSSVTSIRERCRAHECNNLKRSGARTDFSDLMQALLEACLTNEL